MIQITLRTPDEILAAREAEDEPTERITLDIKRSAAKFLVKYVEHRNLVARINRERAENKRAAAAGEEPRKSALEGRDWTRKSMAEGFLEGVVEDLQEALKPMVDDIGELPEADDKKTAQQTYAEQSIEWLKKHRG